MYDCESGPYDLTAFDPDGLYVRKFKIEPRYLHDRWIVICRIEGYIWKNYAPMAHIYEKDKGSTDLEDSQTSQDGTEPSGRI